MIHHSASEPRPIGMIRHRGTEATEKNHSIDSGDATLGSSGYGGSLYVIQDRQHKGGGLRKRPNPSLASLCALCTTNFENLVRRARYFNPFSSTVFRRDSRGFDQLVHRRGAGREDRRNLFPAPRRHLIPMSLRDLLDQSLGTQQRQQPTHPARWPPVHRRVLRPSAVAAAAHIAVAEPRDQVLPATDDLQQPRVLIPLRVERPIAATLLDQPMAQ